MEILCLRGWRWSFIDKVFVRDGLLVLYNLCMFLNLWIYSIEDIVYGGLEV